MISELHTQDVKINKVKDFPRLKTKVNTYTFFRFRLRKRFKIFLLYLIVNILNNTIVIVLRYIISLKNAEDYSIVTEIPIRLRSFKENALPFYWEI